MNDSISMTLFLSSHIKNADRDELHDMIQECMDDGPEIPELRQQVKLTSKLSNVLRFPETNQKTNPLMKFPA